MKAFTTIFLLLAGFIFTCRGKHIEVENNQESSSSEESAETKEFIQQIETACYENTGSSQTFEALAASFAVAPNCVLMQIDQINFMNDLARLKTNASNRHQFFPKYCPLIRKALVCLDPLVNELSKCLDGDDGLILHGVYNATPEVIDFICKNDGEILFQGKGNLDDCIKNYSKYSDECTALVSSSTNIMAVSKYGETQCRELAQVRGCMQRKFNECNGPVLNELFDIFWHAVLDNSPCGTVITGLNEIAHDKAR